MLDENMQKVPVTVSAATAVVALQVIARAAASGAIKDNELSVVGGAREELVAQVQEATGINFDQARAAQARAQQQALEAARRAAAEQQAAQPEAPAAPEAPEVPEPVGEALNEVEVVEETPAAE